MRKIITNAYRKQEQIVRERSARLNLYPGRGDGMTEKKNEKEEKEKKEEKEEKEEKKEIKGGGGEGDEIPNAVSPVRDSLWFPEREVEYF